MRVKRLEIKNMFQHEHLVAEFTDFHGIIGSNGSGKSNALEAMLMCLGYSFDMPGDTSSTIRIGQNEGSVEVIVESEGEDYTISLKVGKTTRRTIKSSVLPKPITARALVLDYIQDSLLRMDYKLSAATNIIRQLKLREGLFETPARRLDFFSSLAGIRELEGKRTKLSDAKDKMTTSMVELNIEGNAAEIKASREILDTKSLEVEETRSQLRADKEEYDIAKVSLVNLEKFREHKGKLDAAKVVQTTLTVELSDTEATLKIIQTDKADIETTLKGIEGGIEQARTRVAEFTAAKTAFDARKKLFDGIEATKAELVHHDTTDPGAYDGKDPEKIAPIIIKLQSLKMALETDIAAISALPEDTAPCPVCKKLFSKEERLAFLTKSNEELAEMLPRFNRAVEMRTTAVNATDAYSTRVNAYTRQSAVLSSKLKSIEDALISMGGSSTDEYNFEVPDPKDSKALVESFDISKNTIASFVEKETKALAGISALKQRLATAIAEIDSIDVSAAGGNEVELIALVGKYETAMNNVNQKVGEITASEKFIVELEAKQEELLVTQKKNKRANEFVNMLESARTVFKRDQFPSIKIARFIESALVKTNEYLELMESGFKVAYNHESGFTAYFADKQIRADRLSVGQQAVFAVAFRFSVTHVSGIGGFIILDEPTDGLDTEHKDLFINALQNIKAHINQQVIIITHEHSVIAACDGVFNLT